ncbi:MAG: glycosyltransferase family protein [Bacteroidota bacterium]
MAKCIFIVQGEGRGHLSQSVALKEYLEDAGHSVEALFVGCNNSRPLPDYYRNLFEGKLSCFASPWLVRTPNRKGIYVGRTLLFNLFRTFLYLKEVRRIRQRINALEPDVVFNFYDVVGALALKGVSPSVKRIGVGHHFYLHLDGYRCGGGKVLHKWFLKLHTRAVMKSCDHVLALSFREVPGSEEIRVVPPLVRKQFRETGYEPGSSYLSYLMNEGFVSDMITIARDDPGFQVDLFSDLPTDTPVPPGIRLHPISDKAFMQKMSGCRGLITTAGFDSVAEAVCVGAPLVVVPVKNHFEQRCNSFDVERSGLGIAADNISAEVLQRIRPVDHTIFREWVNRAGEMIINQMGE